MYHGQVEGTDLVVLDKRFAQLFAGYMRVTRHWTGAIWSEGPAWFAAGRYLIWSDIPNNRMMRFVEESGQVSVFRQGSNNSNGNTVDNQGRLVTCEHLTRRVTRTEFDGSIKVLADKWEGKRFNSPNDAVVKSDNSIWFTDPAYGIDGDNEGEPATPEIDGCYVYRIDPKTGAVTRLIDNMVRPNGIAFSPDEKLLYVADTGATHKAKTPRAIRRYSVNADGKSVKGPGEIFAELAAGGRIVRRLPGRPVRTDLDEHRQGRLLLRAGREADRQDPDPRNRRQRDFRRSEAQSPLHLRHDVALFGPADDQRVEARLKRRQALLADN